ncbi:2346_t:CDS:2 [Paraglomus occultum]|uniref:2346_t:CDS:1 n=1 Tax=Paraglomus occultum TaxID=144539 RepID=A0A9N9G7K7_9GLOM|nr:2346_t:CDS:2 [Paraglomus occultum]
MASTATLSAMVSSTSQTRLIQHIEQAKFSCTTLDIVYYLDTGSRAFTPQARRQQNKLCPENKNTMVFYKLQERAQVHKEFLGNDCTTALARGHCWNEIMD